MRAFMTCASMQMQKCICVRPTCVCLAVKNRSPPIQNTMQPVYRFEAYTKRWVIWPEPRRTVSASNANKPNKKTNNQKTEQLRRACKGKALGPEKKYLRIHTYSYLHMPFMLL